MKTKIIFISVLLLLIIMSSCTKHIYFTQHIRKEVENKNLDIHKIQFYISKTVVLQRIMPINEGEIARGKIKLKNGNYIDQIIIHKDTPGICEFIGENKIYISFEKNNNNTLIFNREPYSNYYELLINKEDENYNGVVYDSLIYIVNYKSENAKLWIKKDEIYKQEIKQRIVKGKIVK